MKVKSLLPRFRSFAVVIMLVTGSLQIAPLDLRGQSKAVNTAADAADYSKIIAHRGAWKTAGLPQNSIASLKKAIQLGCMGSEFDVQLTLDDSLVVNHDPVYAGDSIEKSNYQQLMRVPLNNGEHLPTLYHYLTAALNSGGHTTPVLEIKPSIINKARAIKTTRAVLKMVAQFKAIDKIIFISFDYAVLEEIHRLYPKAVTQYLNGDKPPAALKADGINGADYHYSVFQKHLDWTREAKDKGIALNGWTVDDTAAIDWLLAENFDAITTNEPELAARRAARHHRIYGQKKLVFSDEFNQNGAPDRNSWTYDTGSHGWGNHELENYTDGDSGNVFIKNGLLHIIARQDKSQPKGYSSVRMVQKNGFLYGRLEIRARLPTGRGLWPALWLLPDHNNYGGWPSSGEIDLMENVGYNPDSVFFTVHTQKYNHVKGTQKSQGIYAPTLYSAFHVYALEWTADSLSFYMDDHLQFSFANQQADFKSWPYDKPFHLLMNIAVGGDWGGKQGIDNSIFPATMLIDYVRVYQ